MRHAGFTALALLTACGGGAAENKAAETATITLESEDVEAGARPRLTLSCGEVGRSLMLRLVRRPDPATPPAPAEGVFKTDGDAPVRVAMAWVQEDAWSLRMDDAAEAALIRGIVAGRSTYFTGPLGTTDHVWRWDLARLDGDLDRLRAACG